MFDVVDDDDKEESHKVDDDSEHDWFFDVFPELVDSQESTNGEMYDETNEPSETEPIYPGHHLHVADIDMQTCFQCQLVSYPFSYG